MLSWDLAARVIEAMATFNLVQCHLFRGVQNVTIIAKYRLCMQKDKTASHFVFGCKALAQSNFNLFES